MQGKINNSIRTPCILDIEKAEEKDYNTYVVFQNVLPGF